MAAPTPRTTSRCAASSATAIRGPNLATLDQDTGELVGFYHPRRHTWEAHFRLEAGEIIGVTPEGRATVFIFRFNDDVRVVQRQALMRHGRYLG